MDNKVTKERIVNHLEYDWFKYIILLAVVLFVVIFSFDRINALRDEEQIDFFITSYAGVDNDFVSTTIKSMSTSEYDQSLFGKNVVSSINLNYQSPAISEFSTLISVVGINSDVLIADKSFVVTEDKSAYVNGFMELNDEILSMLGIAEDDYEFLRVDENSKMVESGGKRYAIRISNLSKMKGFASFKVDNDSYADIDAYLFVLNGKANLKKDGNFQTVFVLKKFFEKYGV